MCCGRDLSQLLVGGSAEKKKPNKNSQKKREEMRKKKKAKGKANVSQYTWIERAAAISTEDLRAATESEALSLFRQPECA